MPSQPRIDRDGTAAAGPRRPSARSAASALAGGLAYESARLTRSAFTWVILGVAMVASMGGAWLSTSAGMSAELNLPGGPSVIAISTGFAFVPYLAALSGLAAMSGDSGSAVARSLFMWVPGRWPVLVAKAAWQVVVAAVLTAGAVAGGLAGLAFGTSAAPDISREAVTVAVGGLLAAVLLALFGLGIGAMVRRAIDGYLVLFGLILVLPVIAGAVGLSSPGLSSAARLLPMAAANALFDPLQFTMGRSDAGVVVLAAWAVGSLAIGAVGLHRRDIA